MGVRYILELIEMKEANPVRNVLVEPEILQIVYEAIINLKHDDCTEKNVELSVLCGKVIAAIGLAHSFTND